MIGGTSHPASRKKCRVEGFHRQECRERNLLVKEKKGLFQVILGVGKGPAGLLSCRLPDCADQEIAD